MSLERSSDVTQGFGKKHRPVFVLSVITTLEKYQNLVEILMEETGTLGVRIKEEPRIVADRVIMIMGEEFSVRVKVSKHCGRIIAAKPEFEDMKKATKIERALERCGGRSTEADPKDD